MHQFLFFDINKNKINEYKSTLQQFTNTSFLNSSLDDLVTNYKFDILVSPANSFGDMRGGIDEFISKKWPGIDKNVLSKVSESKYVDYSDKKYIPVGHCEIVSLDIKTNKYLLIAPTMYLPGNIYGTNNVERAFSAIMKQIENYKNVIIACPCLGTGIGGLSGTDSALQIKNVLNKYVKN